jgi:hypothetical protein
MGALKWLKELFCSCNSTLFVCIAVCITMKRNGFSSNSVVISQITQLSEGGGGGRGDNSTILLSRKTCMAETIPTSWLPFFAMELSFPQ